jgi:phosphatidylglycerophosphate synthase
MKNIIKYTDFLSFYFYQKIAFFFLERIRKYEKITPNLITALALFFGILSAFLVVKGFLWSGAFLLQFSFVLDCLDGQLARAKNLSSEIGMWFDNIVDRVIENAIIISVVLINDECRFGILLVFINMFYSYLADLEIYQNIKYKKLSNLEKIIFSPIYLLNRSFVILILTISIFYFKILYFLLLIYIYGLLFRIYRKIYGRA